MRFGKGRCSAAVCSSEEPPFARMNPRIPFRLQNKNAQVTGRDAGTGCGMASVPQVVQPCKTFEGESCLQKKTAARHGCGFSRVMRKKLFSGNEADIGQPPVVAPQKPDESGSEQSGAEGEITAEAYA